jgi:hypothetical protein
MNKHNCNGTLTLTLSLEKGEGNEFWSPRPACGERIKVRSWALPVGK